MKRQKILWLTVLCCLLLVAAVAILVTTHSQPPAEPVSLESPLPTASAPNPTPEATASGVSDAAATATPTIQPTATPKATETPKATATPTAVPAPTSTPTPEPEKEAETVTLSIVCHKALESELLPEPVRAVLPADGVMLSPVTVELQEGESVWDVLQRVCRDNGVALEASWTPAYHTAYVQGIGQLYEFDCGQGSGWVYSVNGVVPGVGCSGYTLKDGDVIRWMYSCDYGNDVGG